MKALALSSIAVSCLAVFAVPQQAETCNNMPQCLCALEDPDISSPESTPCFDDAVIGFNSSFYNKSGCCDDGSCSSKNCQFKLVIAATAVSGQTCDWELSPPRSDGQKQNVDDSDQFTWSSFSGQVMACGEGKTYELRADGKLVRKIVVNCGHCN